MFAVVTRNWFEEAETNLCHPRGSAAARARCFEDQVKLLLDFEGSGSVLFVRALLDPQRRTHSRTANPGLAWLAAATPEQQAAWAEFEKGGLLIERAEKPVFLPVPAALEQQCAKTRSARVLADTPAGKEQPDSAADAFNCALRDGLAVLAAGGGVLMLTARCIGASAGEPAAAAP